MKKLLLSAAALCVAIAPVCSQSLNLNLDNAHAPFVYGVASADPSENSVLIWTAVAPEVSLHNATITWQISADSLFASVLNNGTLTIDSGKGYTVKTDVTGLSQGSTYYYRFEHAGNYSSVGITYTAFSSSLDSMKFGLVSCSSLFSGYFNAYRQMAAMPGMRALVHVGDVIYDGVDPEEEVRVPEGAEEDLRDSILEDWRARHRLYLSDPDFREARRKFPWIVTWDNHDVYRSNPATGAKAFREFVPFREDETDSTKVYRKVSMGPLVDFFMIDYQYRRGHR
jgi:alkaline phosphatase D